MYRFRGLFPVVQISASTFQHAFVVSSKHGVQAIIGFIGCMGGAGKLLLAKVKNASGRIGIFFSRIQVFLW